MSYRIFLYCIVLAALMFSGDYQLTVAYHTVMLPLWATLSDEHQLYLAV